MTEPRSTDAFEARLGPRLVAFTDPAIVRRIDPLEVSRTSLGARPQRHAWRLSARWGAAIAASVLIVAAGVVILGRPADSDIGTLPTPSTSATPSPAASAGGPIPVALLHPWQRPYAVAPDILGGPEVIRLTSDLLELVPTPRAAESRSAIVATSDDTLEVTATGETAGCAAGDTGAYRWSLEGSGTVMTLSAIGADGCAAREAALTGVWVRSNIGGVDQPSNGGPPGGDPVTLRPGTYSTSAFDPFGVAGASGQVRYTVPEGWKPKDDRPESFTLHQLPMEPGSDAIDTVLVLLARPRMSADFRHDFQDICGEDLPQPMADVGGAAEDLLEAIQARPGLTSAAPEPVTIDGYQGWSVDLRLAADWNNGCSVAPGTMQVPGTAAPTRIVNVPILLAENAELGVLGPQPQGVGIGPDHPLRLILLDLGEGQTLAIAIHVPDPAQASRYFEAVAQVTSVIESFEFHKPSP
jgi:hypothetical protein